MVQVSESYFFMFSFRTVKFGPYDYLRRMFPECWNENAKKFVPGLKEVDNWIFISSAVFS